MKQKMTAIEKALKVIECFSKVSPELSVQDISEKLSLPFPSAHRIVKTLIETGYLYRNPNTKLLSLGAKLYYLGKIANTSMNIINISLPLMNDLRDKTGETVNLYFREGNFRICYEHAESTQTLKHSAELGKYFPLWAGASGKCFLAFLPEDHFEEIIAEAKPLTVNTITDREKFISEIKLIRKRNFSISNSEREKGVSSIATPIFNQESKMVACLAVSGPSFRFSGKKLNDMIELAKEHAQKISSLLGYDTQQKKGVRNDSFIYVLK